ncbi:MAG: hypothetical protein EZS28_033879, partial [Streblomastix strix]
CDDDQSEFYDESEEVKEGDGERDGNFD